MTFGLLTLNANVTPQPTKPAGVVGLHMCREKSASFVVKDSTMVLHPNPFWLSVEMNTSFVIY